MKNRKNKKYKLIQIPIYKDAYDTFYNIIDGGIIDIKGYLSAGYKITNLSGSLAGTNSSTYKLFTFILEKEIEFL